MAYRGHRRRAVASLALATASTWGFTTSLSSNSSGFLETHVGVARRRFTSFLKAGLLWLQDKLYLDRHMRDALGYEGQVRYGVHRESHAASAFYPSPFEEAGIPHDGRGRGMGDRVDRSRARQCDRADQGDSLARRARSLVLGLQGPFARLWIRSAGERIRSGL
jgi:predicted NodU family carbamoyl transferase